MSKLLPRICSVSTAEVDWLPSVNSWTGSRVRFSWGAGREERPQDEGIHWKSGLQAFLSWLPPPTHVRSLLPTCCHVAHAYCKEKQGLTIEETEQTVWESRLWLWLPMVYYSLFHTVLWAVRWQVAQDCPWPSLSEGKCQPGCPTFPSHILPQERIMGSTCI